MKLHSETSWKIKKILDENSGEACIVVHQNPDGDAMGSGLAMRTLLQKQNRKAHLIVPNAVGDYLKWMPDVGDAIDFESSEQDAIALLNNSSLLFCLDFNDPRRAGGLEKHIQSFDGQKIVIDHHQHPKDFADVLYSDTTSPATALLIHRIAKELDWLAMFDNDVATCLYTGIITDTGSFRFSSVTSETHEAAAFLLTFNFKHDEIHSKVFDSFSPQRLKLYGHCFLHQHEVLEGGRVSIMYVTLKDHDDFNIKKGDTEGLVNFNLSLSGVDVGVLFVENEHMIKISFRSKADIPVNEFSGKYFDGGGHINAAGGRSYLSLQKTIQKFKACIGDFMSEH